MRTRIYTHTHIYIYGCEHVYMYIHLLELIFPLTLKRGRHGEEACLFASACQDRVWRGCCLQLRPALLPALKVVATWCDVSRSVARSKGWGKEEKKRERERACRRCPYAEAGGGGGGGSRRVKHTQLVESVWCGLWLLFQGADARWVEAGFVFAPGP